MFPRVDYTWNKPEYQGRRWGDVTITPTGDPAPMEPDGDINLFVQASQVFGQLNATNVFTASTNTFLTDGVVLSHTSVWKQDLVVRRVHVVSDGAQKEDIVQLPDSHGT